MSEARLHDACDSTGKTELSTGWPVVLAATLGCGAGVSSLPFYSLGTFSAPLQQEFGWTRGEISASFLYLTLVLTAPALGWLLDRIGPRKIAMVAIPCFAAVLFAISRFDGPLTAFYSLFAIAALAGGGTCPILYTRAVNSQFQRMRGLALGITLGGMGVVAIVLPPLLSIIITEHGWRTGYLLLACLALLPRIFVMTGFRNTAAEARPKPAQRRAILGQALTSRIFWTIAMGFAAIAIAVSALVVHMVPLLRDAGLPPLQAAAVASFTGFGVLLGRLVIGWLIDRFFAPYVAACVFTLTAAGCLLLAYGGGRAAPPPPPFFFFFLSGPGGLVSFLSPPP